MNMSYCRFRNTANDLSDCLDNLTDVLERDEHDARKRLIKFCRDVVYSADNGDIPEKSENQIELEEIERDEAEQNPEVN